MHFTLRSASPVDCEGIVGVVLSCWRVSYSNVLPSHVVQSMTEDRARVLWERVLSTQCGDGDENVIVATDTGTGAMAGVVRYGLDRPGHGIISSLYVDPASQGCGIGSRLLHRAESALAAAGADWASLCVFAANAASIAFYANHGWLPGSETPARDREFGEPVYRLSKSFPGARPAQPPSRSEPGGRRADHPGAASAFAGRCP